MLDIKKNKSYNMQVDSIKLSWGKPEIYNLATGFTTSTDCNGKTIQGEADARCSTLGS